MKKSLDSIKKKKPLKEKKAKQKKSNKKKSTILAGIEKKSPKIIKLGKPALYIIGTLSAIIIIFLIFCIAQDVALANRIYPNIWVGELNLSNKTRAEAEEILNQKYQDYISSSQISLNSKKGNYEFVPKEVKAEINLSKSSYELYQIGHSTNFIQSGLTRIRLYFKPIRNAANIDFDNKKWTHFVDKIARGVETPFKNASLEIENGEVKITPSSTGFKIDRPIFEQNVKYTLGTFNQNNIQIPEIISTPQIKESDAVQAKKKAESIISEAITVSYKEKKYTLGTSKIENWINFIEGPKNKVLGVKNDTEKASRSVSDYILAVQLDDKKIQEYVDQIATELDIIPKDAGLIFSNGKLRVVSSSVTGRSVDREKLKNDIKSALNSDSYKRVTIKIVTKIPDVREDNLIKLGIKELISEGISSYAGSPRNRIHNIETGASKFNGAVIKPGEEFSFNEQLGPVGPQTGFLPELVIKEHKTIPEYGGGLCQVSTTAFRAALLAGFPILERKEHAYRVKYYEWPYGPGVDSTIYPPHPDMRFKNDSSTYVLIQTRAFGSRLIYDFYGSKNGKYGVINRPQILWSKGDGSLATLFSRDVYQNGKVIRTDTFKSIFKSPNLYPKPAVESGAPVR